MDIFDIVIWIGAALTLAGLAGILWCIWAVSRAKRARLPEPAFKARMQKVVAANIGALAASMLGLMAVVVGIMLGG